MNKFTLFGMLSVISFFLINFCIYKYKNEEYNSSLDIKLIDSVHRESPEEVARHLKSGANPNFIDEMLSTPLTIACALDNIEIVEILILNGSDPNISDGEGYSPLMYSCQAMNYTIAEILIKHGADAKSKNNRGKSALDIAKEYNQKKILSLMKGKEVEN